MAFVLRATLRAAPQQMRVITPVRPGAARGLVATVSRQVLREFGVLGPPIWLHSPSPAALAAAWVMLRETLIADGRHDRATKEAVAAAVSLGNDCPYCVEVHSATLHGLGGSGADALAIADDRLGHVADPRLRTVAAWARASATPDQLAHQDLPGPAGDIAELIAVAVTFQYYNRMANVFLVDSPFPPGVPDAARTSLLRVFGRLMRPAASKSRPPGRSLDLLPGAALPDDLRWAREDRNLADAFARVAAAVDAGGRRSVPSPVRDLVLSELARWDGGRHGVSRAWADDAVAGVAPSHRPLGRLALLAAMTSYQVDEPVVAPVLAELAGGLPPGRSPDGALVELVSWASLAAARTIGGWLWADATGRGDARAAEPPAA